MAEETEELSGNAINVEEIVSEKVNPHYWNDQLITPPIELYRINSRKGRVYFRFKDAEHQREPILYMGTSSITSQAPTPKVLIRYKADMGWKASEKEYYMLSLYGSFSDSRIAEFVKTGRFFNGLEGLPEQLKEYYYNQRFWIAEDEFAMLSKWIKQDMIGLEKFIYDRKVEFVFVEFPVVSEIDSTATQIDFGAFFDMEVDKIEGQPRKGKDVIRVFGLFNYKSGRIYAHHGIQSMAERNMFMEMYPEFTENQVRSFNITIRDFKKMNWNEYRPTSSYGKPYILRDWTDVASEEEFRHYLGLAKLKREKQLLHPITMIKGDMRLGDEPSQYIVTKTILEMIEDGTWKRYEKSNAGVPEELLTAL